jgi:hypothetical protein
MEETKDKWDRKTNFGCCSCMYYVSKKNSNPGRCRRYAPSMQGYPVVYEEDWCGEHKLGTNPLRGNK